MIRVEIDLNVRVRGNWTFSGLEDTSGPVEAGQVVEVFEAESGLSGPGIVEEIDEDRRLIYLSVDWAALRDSKTSTNDIGRAPSGGLITSHRNLRRSRIFLSWCYQDRALKEALLRDLLPALGVFTDLGVEWWEDSHLTSGEDLTAGIIDRLDEVDFGLLLLSTRYFGRPFIQKHELPRFVGPLADKGSLLVALGPLPAFGPHWNIAGIESRAVFSQADRSFAELSGARRTRFANELAAGIRRRILSPSFS